MNNLAASFIKSAIGAFVLLACIVGNPDAARASTLPLTIVHPDITLTPWPGRFDYESIDPRRHKLFIADLGAGTVSVVDLKTDHLVRTIGNTPSVHGVLAVPSLDEVFATATGTNTLDVIMGWPAPL